MGAAAPASASPVAVGARGCQSAAACSGDSGGLRGFSQRRVKSGPPEDPEEALRKAHAEAVDVLRLGPGTFQIYAPQADFTLECRAEVDEARASEAWQLLRLTADCGPR